MRRRRNLVWSVAAVVAFTLLGVVGARPALSWEDRWPLVYPPFEVKVEEEMGSDGRMVKAWLGDDGLVHWARQVHPGGPYGTVHTLWHIEAIGTPAMTQDCSGRMFMFVVGSGNQIHNTWEHIAGYHFNPQWASLGGYLTSNPDAFTNSRGEMELFARGDDHAVAHRRQMGPCAGWDRWGSIGGNIMDYPRVVESQFTGKVIVEAQSTETSHWTWAKRHDYRSGWRWE